MKLSTLLLTLMALSIVKSEEELLKRAAAQLERLSNFRKPAKELETNLQKLRKSPELFNKKITGLKIHNNGESAKDGEKGESKDSKQRIFVNADAMKRIDELAATAYKLFNDPHYEAMVQERIKRSGSGDFVSGIAGKVINGVVGTSGGLSSGLSGGSSGPQPHDSYGVPVEPYESFSFWDIKKAILNTVIQALKALAGGAIAFKGHLIKGGGFLVQTTGRVISSAGDAASSLGTKIASGAIISAPKPAYDSTGYSYHAPHTQDYSYDGPPPSLDAGYSEQDYHQGQHESASDDHGEKDAGLLVIKPLKDTTVEVIHHEHYHHIDEPHQPQHDENPSDYSSISPENHSGHSQSNSITKLVGLITGTSIPYQQTYQNSEHIEYPPVEHKDKPSDLQHDSPHVFNQPSLVDYNKHNQGDYPGIHTGTAHTSLSLENNNLQQIAPHSNQLGYQEFQTLLNPHLTVPINSPQTFKDAELNYGFDGSSQEPLKIPILDHHNTLDSSLPVLPLGYGVPMTFGFDATAMNTYNNWKRALMVPRRRKNFKRSPSKYIDYRNRYANPYRKH